ncbi:hypothetical protein FSHL1_003493 [Fusarium sambucinum]
MSESEKTRPAIVRQLKPGPRRPAQTVHSPRLKSEVHFTHPGSIPDIGEDPWSKHVDQSFLTLVPLDTLRIRTTDVAQPFLDPRSMQES